MPSEEDAQKLVALFEMGSDCNFDELAFMVGFMAAKNVDLAIDAFCAMRQARESGLLD
jgi:hypothetical protein